MGQNWCPYSTPITTIGKVFKTWHCAGRGKNNNICANCFHAACNPWPNLLWWGKNVIGFAQNYESMGGAKGQGGETYFPTYSWMANMELCEGKKWRNKLRRNRHERGHPPISKHEGLTETAAWRENWQVAGSTEGGRTSDKCGISGGSGSVNVSVIGRNIFCARYKHGNENKWRYCRIFRNWAEEIHS